MLYIVFSQILTSSISLRRKNSKTFCKKVDFKDLKFPVKIKDIHNIRKKKSIVISVFGYENMVKYPSYVSKKKSAEEIKAKGIMFLSKILSIHLCIILYYIMEENIFAVFIYKS